MNRDTKIYQGPEGLALCLVPAEDLDQGPTGPEGPTPGYKFYWPEVVVSWGEQEVMEGPGGRQKGGLGSNGSW